MRESWRKNELKQETEWVPSGWVSHSNKGDETDRKRGREHRDKWSERWNVRRRAYVLAFVWNWAEVGFRNKSNGAFCTFFCFFFWISAWISRFGRFRPESARFRPELAWFHTNRPESEPRRRESAKNTWNPRGTTRRDAQAAASLARHCVPPRRTRVRHLWCRIRAS